MKKYIFHTRKQNNLNFHDLYEVENNIAFTLYPDEETIDYKIMQYLKKNSRKEIEILDKENLLDAIYKRHTIYSDYKNLKKYDKVLQAKNEPGEYFSRIYRPLLNFNKLSLLSTEKIEKLIQHESGKYEFFIPRNDEIIIASINQLTILTDELNSIFKTLHPAKENYKSYGHNLRNLLILACTEVEAQLKGIIKSNSQNNKNIYNTKDYFKLKEILKLDQYSVGFNYYPSINLCSPFKNWKEDSPTKSLRWYDSYNAVKHDREGSFHRANLIDTINAVSALAILIIAQYGMKTSYWNERIGNYYNFHDVPVWNLLDYYLPPFKNTSWRIKPLNF